MFKRTIKLRIHNPKCELEQHGNWIDLSINGECKIEGLKVPIISNIVIPDSKQIYLGISTVLPKWYRAEVKPRSSTYRKFGIILANSVGEIEHDFADQWFSYIIPFKDVTIPDGERIMQMQISLRPDAPWYMKIADLFISGFKFKNVDLIQPNRKGDGSTDKKINYNTQNLLCTQ